MYTHIYMCVCVYVCMHVCLCTSANENGKEKVCKTKKKLQKHLLEMKICENEFECKRNFN